MPLRVAESPIGCHGEGAVGIGARARWFELCCTRLCAECGVHVQLNELTVIEAVGDATALGHAFGELVVLLRRRIPAEAAFRRPTLRGKGVAQLHSRAVVADHVRPQVARMPTRARPGRARCREAMVRCGKWEGVPVPRLL